jgi:uncharacterized protein
MPIRRSVRMVDVPGYPGARFRAFDLDAGRSGPTVTIAAGTGGTAYPGIEACWRLIRSLEESTFNGRITVFPVLDIAGFMQRMAHFCALDNTALSTAFRSHQAAGPATQAIARAALDALGSPDLHIDLRGGEVHEQHAHWVTAMPNNATLAARAAELSNATLRVAVDGREEPGVELGSAGAMANAGVAALAITTGGVGIELEADAKILEYSVTGVLKELGVLKWESTARPTSPHTVGPATWTHLASSKGLWIPEVSAGAHVRKGHQLGQICDYFGSVIETVVAPFDGWVLRVLTTLAVDATPRPDGDTWFMQTVTIAEQPGSGRE